MSHTINFTEGDAEECFCSFGEDHGADDGDWNLFDDDE